MIGLLETEFGDWLNTFALWSLFTQTKREKKRAGLPREITLPHATTDPDMRISRIGLVIS